MEGGTDGRTDKWTDGWTEGRRDGWTDGWRGKQTDRERHCGVIVTGNGCQAVSTSENADSALQTVLRVPSCKVARVSD